MRTEQAQRIAREKFDFIYKKKYLFLSKDDLIKFEKLREIYLDNAAFTEYDYAVIDKYYDRVLEKEFNLPKVPTHHDNIKKIRY